MTSITNGLHYENKLLSFALGEQFVHIITLEQNNPQLTLLISKASEAINPQEDMNHVGDGSTISDFLKVQKKVRFIINGGFSHYRKNFYHWDHQSFHVGDPVGLVKIRNHFFEDWNHQEHYGFLIQENKGNPWKIKNKVSKNEKYILGCTPLLIWNNEKINIPQSLMEPLESGLINPPSILAHGLKPHPRTAIGEKNNSLVFIVVEGVNGGGCSLLELQSLGVSMGLTSMLNLDGGGSSQFRLFNDSGYLENNISKEDSQRILGHMLVIFDSTLD